MGRSILVQLLSGLFLELPDQSVHFDKGEIAQRFQNQIRLVHSHLQRDFFHRFYLSHEVVNKADPAIFARCFFRVYLPVVSLCVSL
jgi:hypothetical protein